MSQEVKAGRRTNQKKVSNAGNKRWKTCLAYMLAAVLALGTGMPGQLLTAKAAGDNAVVFEASEITITDGVPSTEVNYGNALDTLKNLEEGTITIRYRTAKDGLMSLFSVANSASANTHTHVYVNGSQIGYEVRNGSNVNTGSAAAGGACDQNWHTVTFAFSKTGTKAYYDGKKVIDNANKGFISSSENTDSVNLGKTARPAGSNEYLFSGVIHSIEVRSDVLNEAQILERQQPTVQEEKEIELPDTAYRTEDQSLFYQGYQGSVSYRIPSLLTTQNGTVLAAIDKRQSGSGDQGNIDTSLRRSFDNGKTWTDGQVVYNMPAGQSQHSLTIDPAMVEDTETGRIFMLVDMFPESQAAMNTSLLENGSGYKKVGEKQYCILRDYESKLDATHNYTKTYTIREHGEVWLEGAAEADAVPTEYTIPEFHTGQLYKNDEPAGNIFIYTGSNAGELKVVRNMRIWSSYSDDDGETWSDPVDLTYFYKKDWMMFAGLGPGTGIQLKNGEHKGRLLIPIYVANRNWTSAQASSVIYSDDHGKTWKLCDSSPLETAGVNIESGSFNGQILTESQLVEMNDGTLIQFFRNGSGSLKYSFSEDGGSTWTAPVTDTAVPEVYCQLTAVHYPKAIDGKEAVILANPNGSGRNNGRFRIGLYNAEDRSFDWKYTQQVNEAPYAYSCLSVLANGDIGLLYEENIPDIKFTSVSLDWLTAPREAVTTKPVIKAVKAENSQGGITFTVDFDSYLFTVGTPVLDFVMDGGAQQAEYVSGNASKQLTFRFTGDAAYETITVKNVSAPAGSEIGSATRELPYDSEYTFLSDGSAVCTCRISNLGVQPKKISIPFDEPSAVMTLSGEMKESGCAREDHEFSPSYQFEVIDAGETAAALENGKLSVSAAGTVRIKITGSLNGKTAEAEGSIQVVKAQAGEDVNQPPAAKDPVPAQVVDSMEGTSFQASDIADDPENQPLVITRILSEPDGSVMAELKNGTVTLYGSLECESSMMVTVSDGVKTAVVKVPISVSESGAYDKSDYLSDHDNYRGETVIGWEDLKVDKSPSGGTITLLNEDGEQVTFAKGYGAHCTSSVTFNLPEGHSYQKFETYYGVDASQKVNAIVTFEIVVDGQVTHTSKEMDASSAMGFGSVDIAGASELVLKATAKSGNGNGHSEWAGSRLTGGKADSVYKDSLVQMISSARIYQEGAYTKDSLEALQAAIEMAEGAVNNDLIQQYDVFNQMKALKKAVDELRAEVPATGITLNHKELTLETGANRKIFAVLETADGAESTDGVTWSSDTPGVASVSEQGRVTAVSEGEAVITAVTDSGINASCKVNVVANALVEVSFDGGTGADGTAPSSITDIPGSNITLPDNPFTREGYKFAGWSDGNSVYQAGDSYQVPGNNITLTAVWNKKDVPSVQIHNLTGTADSQQNGQPGSNAADGDINTHWHTNWSQNDVVINEDPSKCSNNGYTIDLGQEYPLTRLEYLPRQGESTSDNGIENGRIGKFRILSSTDGNTFSEIPLEGTVIWANSSDLKTVNFETVNARYIRIEVLGSYGIGGEDTFINAAEFYVYREDDGTVECTCSLSDPAFEGKNILIPINEESIRTTLSAAAVLSGICEVEGHADADVQYEYTIEEDTAHIAALQGNVLTVNGEGTVKVNVTASVNGKTSSKTAEFHVIKETAKTYRLTFKGGEETGGTAPSEIIAEAGTEVVLPQNTFTKNGYEFQGWNDGISVYAPGSTYTVGRDDISFTAVWKEIVKTYRLTFSGGEGTAGTAPAEISAKAGADVTLPQNTFTKNGFEFQGWNDGTNTCASGSTYKVGDKDVTFIAVWKEKAKEPNGNQGGNENPKPVQAPGKPANLKASSQKVSSLKLSWPKVNGAAGYLVYRYNTSQKSWEQVKDLAGTSYVDKKRKAATIYRYKVKAYTVSGGQRAEGAFSAELKAATSPQKPSLKVKQISSKKAQIIWSKKKGSSGYEISMKAGKGKYKWKTTKGSKADSYSKGKLKKGTTYTFRVRAYKKVGKGKSYSAYSKTRTVKMK